MASLDITEKERTALRWALDDYLSQSKDELSRTDDRDYRRALEEYFEQLKSVREKLGPGPAAIKRQAS